MVSKWFDFYHILHKLESTINYVYCIGKIMRPLSIVSIGLLILGETHPDVIITHAVSNQVAPTPTYLPLQKSHLASTKSEKLKTQDEQRHKGKSSLRRRFSI